MYFFLKKNIKKNQNLPLSMNKKGGSFGHRSTTSD